MSRRVLACFVFSIVCVAVPARAATISLVAASPVSVGSSFDVTVQVTDVFAGRAPDDVVVGFGFDVTVSNPAAFQFVDASAGPLFVALNLGEPMVAAFAANPLGIGPGDFSGPLTLATLHFNALQAGSTTIGVTWDQTDLNQGLVFLNVPYGPIAGSTNVRAVTAVPEPATLGLVLVPAAVLPRRGRRR
jgi:hypothetical protein